MDKDNIVYCDAADHCDLCGVELKSNYFIGSAYGSVGERNMCTACFKASGHGVADNHGRNVKRVRLRKAVALEHGMTGTVAYKILEPKPLSWECLSDSVIKRMATHPGDYDVKQVGSHIHCVSADGLFQVKTGLSAKLYVIPVGLRLNISVNELKFVEVQNV